MKNYYLLLSVALLAGLLSCSTKQREANAFAGADGEVKLVTLDPGHFHAALVQKSSYPQISDDVCVYAPTGDDVRQHLQRIEEYNNRSESPTHWNEEVYMGDDFLDKMISEKKGNVVITAGKNNKKADYLTRSVSAGFNVLSDKPMAINKADFEALKACFDIAQNKGVLLYDIMTERFEITSLLQRAFSRIPAVYGRQEAGSLENPAIMKESVHHFFKMVSGNPLKRPAWYFDVRQQGEGIVDVTTHLVDLIQWCAFPDQVIDYKKDIQMLDANRWTTPISASQFKEVTGADSFPEYLSQDLKNDTLQVYSNGDFTYKIKGIYAKVSVIWNYTFPEGGGDTHYSTMRGTKATLVIRQGKEQGYRPTLYIEPVEGTNIDQYEKELSASLGQVTENYPGVSLNKVGESSWEVVLPDSCKVGHEAHFAQVMKNYLNYLKDGALPAWEIPNMLAKYYTTTSALDMAKSK